MRLGPTRPLGAVALAGLTAAACGVASRSGPGVPARSSDRSVAAQADAEALAAAAPLPAGAVATDRSPVSATGRPASAPSSPYLVDVPRFWTVPAAPATVLGYLRAHPPAGGTVATQSSSARAGVTVWWSVGYALAGRPGLPGRGLVVMVAPDGTGTAVRADAQVVYQPRRSPASLVAADQVAALQVTVSSPGPAAVVPAPEVTDRATVDRFVTTLDALPVSTAGAVSCPAETGPSYTVGLRGRRGRVVATVRLAAGECGGLALRVGGRTEPPVTDPGHALLAQVQALVPPARPRSHAASAPTAGSSASSATTAASAARR